MIDAELKAKKAIRPASEWRNRYFALRDFRHPDTGTFRQRGQLYTAEKGWPTRDTAETYGQKIEAEHRSWVKYIGAVPVDA